MGVLDPDTPIVLIDRGGNVAPPPAAGELPDGSDVPKGTRGGKLFPRTAARATS